ncbi:MAG: hypothetical protein C0592_02670 [Marinilabiliales bacterium]|nr:MAG: hypothetical protein C0592_02670 [Marinilabiliales bacterium]
MIMRFIVFIFGMMFLGAFSAHAQSNNRNTASNTPVVKEIKVQSNDDFDTNQKYRTDSQSATEESTGKKSVKADLTGSTPMMKVVGTCAPKAERREE